MWTKKTPAVERIVKLVSHMENPVQHPKAQANQFIPKDILQMLYFGTAQAVISGAAARVASGETPAPDSHPPPSVETHPRYSQGFKRGGASRKFDSDCMIAYLTSPSLPLWVSWSKTTSIFTVFSYSSAISPHKPTSKGHNMRAPLALP